MASVAQHLVTAEEFQLLSVTTDFELVRGEVIETMPPGGCHGSIAVAVAMFLRLWTQHSNGGYVGVEAGYVLARNPDTVHGPDVSYVRVDRIPVSGGPEGFWTIYPNVGVEIVSPSETADEVREKIRDFLMAGTPIVWTVYPRTREVVVHTADGLARTYGNEDVLAFPDVLPGCSCTVAELFT